MMQSLWKKLFIVGAVLLVIASFTAGTLWHQLDSTRTELFVTKAELGATKTELEATKTQLKVTENELNTANAQLGITKTELEATKTQLKSAESRSLQLLDSYSNLRKQINLRLGQREDCQSFITYNDPAISAKVKDITGGYIQQDLDKLWRDYER